MKKTLILLVFSFVFFLCSCQTSNSTGNGQPIVTRPTKSTPTASTSTAAITATITSTTPPTPNSTAQIGQPLDQFTAVLKMQPKLQEQNYLIYGPLTFQGVQMTIQVGITFKKQVYNVIISGLTQPQSVLTNQICQTFAPNNLQQFAGPTTQNFTHNQIAVNSLFRSETISNIFGSQITTSVQGASKTSNIQQGVLVFQKITQNNQILKCSWNLQFTQ